MVYRAEKYTIDEVMKARGNGFLQLHEIVRTGGPSREELVKCLKLLNPRARRVLRKKVILFLFWDSIGYKDPLKFMRVWAKREPESRRKMLERFVRNHPRLKKCTLRHLLNLVFVKGMITKRLYRYFGGGIPLIEKTRLKVCWWAFLKSGCEAVVTLKNGPSKQLQGAVVRVQLAKDSVLMYY